VINLRVKLNGNDFFNVSAPFGDISNIHPNGHTGIDLVMKSGTELFSPVDGIIKRIVDYGDKNLGKGIFIETEDGKTVIMGHLSDFKVKLGQKVSEGDLVALSGNTGNSTGSHLHLGLKDMSGDFISPEEVLNGGSYGMTKSWGLSDASEPVGFFDGAKSFGDFLYKWNKTGSFWEAMYGKPFFEVMTDFFKQLGHDILIFIFGNGDVFFLMPAIIFMFATFFIGKNKFTKWIVPLWFTYFISTVIHHLIK